VNFRRKSVEGLSLDFTLMNVAGFLCYSIFNLSLVLSPKVKEEYQHRFGTVGVPVELNDVLFGLHALLLSSALAVQCVVYPKASGQRVSFNTKLGLAVSAGAGLAYAGFMAWEGKWRSRTISCMELVCDTCACFETV
jgi:cystinosin